MGTVVFGTESPLEAEASKGCWWTRWGLCGVKQGLGRACHWGKELDDCLELGVVLSFSVPVGIPILAEGTDLSEKLWMCFI